MATGEILDTLDERISIARRLLYRNDPQSILESAQALEGCDVNMLYGYVRSFVKLAYCGDVRLVAEQIGITRQSVKNHIVQLENLLDTSLFVRIGAISQLTDMGALWLPKAQEVFELAGAFVRRKAASRAQYQSSQLPLRMLLRDEANSALLRDFAHAWMGGGRELESLALAPFRPYCVVYERQRGAWVSREIGEKSAYFRWFGPEVVSASEGVKLSEMETGSDLQDEVAFLLDDVYVRGGLHFSEVACNIFVPVENCRKPAFYQRLLAEISDDQEKPVIASIIDFIDPLQTDPMPG